MSRMRFDAAVEHALAEAMAKDELVIILGEDVHAMRMNLYVRFGDRRVLPAPISESAFVGAAVGAAMGGLRPVVELIMVDFAAVAMDAVLNHMAKLEAFSGGSWRCPLVLRAPYGAGYGDGGQHGQTLWGFLGSIPGLTVVAPSTPADAAGLMTAAIEHEGPVVFLEHKLLSDLLMQSLAGADRETVELDVPAQGVEGEVPDGAPAVPIGRAAVRLRGSDITVVSAGVGVHRALAAADRLSDEGVGCQVIDLRTLRPLDGDTVLESLRETGRLLVVDEDVRECGLSGELAAVALEGGLAPAFRRVCTEGIIPFDRRRERRVLPNEERIVEAARALVG
jgi:pyruvate dehydrogenase E1 component beta subunit